jgi:hypothetical protein
MPQQASPSSAQVNPTGDLERRDVDEPATDQDAEPEGVRASACLKAAGRLVIADAGSCLIFLKKSHRSSWSLEP